VIDDGSWIELLRCQSEVALSSLKDPVIKCISVLYLTLPMYWPLVSCIDDNTPLRNIHEMMVYVHNSGGQAMFPQQILSFRLAWL